MENWGRRWRRIRAGTTRARRDFGLLLVEGGLSHDESGNVRGEAMSSNFAEEAPAKIKPRVFIARTHNSVIARGVSELEANKIDDGRTHR